MKTLDVHEVAEVLGVSAPTVRKLVRDGRFPQPLLKMKRCVRWGDGQVRKFLAGEMVTAAE